MAHPSFDCARPVSPPSVVDFTISLLLVLGILVSYLPQHVKIVSRRSAAGLSPWFVLLGSVSGTCAFANMLLQRDSVRAMACCPVRGGFACASSLLGVVQIGVQWGCFFVIMLLYLIFAPKTSSSSSSSPRSSRPSTPLSTNLSRSSPTPTSTTPQPAATLLVGSLAFAHLFLTLLASVMLLAFRGPLAIQPWTDLLGLLATSLAAVQYVPQIWTTWTSGRVRSLSIGMMCIQTPGSAVFAASLWYRVGFAGWSTWLTYLVTGCLQGFLLGLALRYRRAGDGRRRAADKLGERGVAAREDELEREGGGRGEETPLLR
ncbi:hypothetical protein LTR04_006187 [Oleoguttula sp. CCFEE 6159]|nr:hypothetical protein LTR04_006187 [Oleoguttula sp. CCFEE 6159]